MLSSGETYPYVSPHGEVYKKAFPGKTQLQKSSTQAVLTTSQDDQIAQLKKQVEQRTAELNWLKHSLSQSALPTERSQITTRPITPREMVQLHREKVNQEWMNTLDKQIGYKQAEQQNISSKKALDYQKRMAFNQRLQQEVLQAQEKKKNDQDKYRQFLAYQQQVKKNQREVDYAVEKPSFITSDFDQTKFGMNSIPMQYEQGVVQFDRNSERFVQHDPITGTIADTRGAPTQYYYPRKQSEPIGELFYPSLITKRNPKVEQLMPLGNMDPVRHSRYMEEYSGKKLMHKGRLSSIGSNTLK